MDTYLAEEGSDTKENYASFKVYAIDQLKTFVFAGHDTTANSVAFGIALIATRPDVQDWIAEEINTIFSKQDLEASSYVELFPRLKRCLAVMVRHAERSWRRRFTYRCCWS